MRNVFTLVILAALGFALWRMWPHRTAGGPGVGIEAPAFTAQTIDGASLALASLRGRVVVLDFWATWCGPCRGMIPHERELVKRFADQQFTFVGISADGDAGDLREFVRKMDMNWPQIHDGPGGPLQQKYDIEYYPSIFVLDAHGIIRYRDVRGGDLDKAVDTLLTELK
jgi:thiol-disulfide isomerase/thioredoxin